MHEQVAVRGAQRLGPGRKRASCSRANAGSSSAVAKWVIAPASRAGRGGAAAAPSRRLGGVARAEPAHAGVELDVHARALRAGMRRQRGARTLAPGHHVGARAPARPSSSSADSAPITSSGPSMPAARSSGRLVRRGHREPGRAPGLRRARRRHGAVPVAVGLDHRAQRRGRGDARERGAVALDRGQVDPGERPHGISRSVSA